MVPDHSRSQIMTRENFIKAYARCHGVSIETATRVAEVAYANEGKPIATAAKKVGNGVGLAILIPMYALGAIVAIRIVLSILGIN